MTQRLLIDGDILAYRRCAGAEMETDWGDDVWTLTTDLKVAKEGFAHDIENLKRLAKAHLGVRAVLPIVALSQTGESTPNWRRDILPTYKSNRAKTRKPTGYVAFLEWVMETYDFIREPTFEADDLLGIELTRAPDTTAIWSADKDLKQIPGRHLITEGGEVRIETIPTAKADWWHLMQTLTGDVTDGYSGCPGVGPVKAEKLLASFWGPDKPHDLNGAWEAVLAAYAKAGLSPEDALAQAQVARIRRAGEAVWQPVPRGI